MGLAVLAAFDDDDLILTVLATLFHYMQKLYFRKQANPRDVLEGGRIGREEVTNLLGIRELEFLWMRYCKIMDGGCGNTYYKCLSN